jgi:cupin superfamily acireductone dioxygenase involved in methionine salvage
VARKKSGRLAAERFRDRAEEIAEFALEVFDSGLSDQHVTWAYDFAIIRLYSEFENLMLEALVVAINNDTSTISARTGLPFPKHLTDEVCEYLILGTGYFDFKGRDGLLKKLQEYLPKDHYLVVAVKRPTYKSAIEKVAALRNFAAHGSAVSKKAALQAVGGQKLASSGAWLKTQSRLRDIIRPLKQLADEIESLAPY